MFFFFQAEDGIRDAQESRGLGDVYKRQVREGLSESELAIFDLMQKPTLAATERERIKQSSLSLIHI